MTIDTTTTAGKIAVMQAFERGDACEWQYREGDGDRWTRVEVPSWDWDGIRYRIKPKDPRTVYVGFGANGYMMVNRSADYIEQYDGSLKIAKFVEVIE